MRLRPECKTSAFVDAAWRVHEYRTVRSPDRRLVEAANPCWIFYLPDGVEVWYDNTSGYRKTLVDNPPVGRWGWRRIFVVRQALKCNLWVEIVDSYAIQRSP